MELNGVPGLKKDCHVRSAFRYMILIMCWVCPRKPHEFRAVSRIRCCAGGSVPSGAHAWHR